MEYYITIIKVENKRISIKKSETLSCKNQTNANISHNKL